MSAQKAAEAKKKPASTMAPPRSLGLQRNPSLLPQHVGETPSPEGRSLGCPLAQPGLGHDFGRVQVHFEPETTQPAVKASVAGGLRAQEEGHIAELAASAVPGPVLAAQEYGQKSHLDHDHWTDDRGNKTENRTGMSDELKAGLESSSGLDLSDVRVHRNSSKPALLNALAYTQGQTIHLAPSQDKHLPHEGWHVVQQLQGRAKTGGLQINDTCISDDLHLEAEADRMGSQATNPIISVQQPQRPLARMCLGGSSRQPVQRRVRIDDGRRRVNEADYLPGGSKSAVGSRHSVASLIRDNVRRVFDSVTELERYANGQTDFIGDVKTQTRPKPFWYRLPENRLTVLGEGHADRSGNVEDVILGLQTSRFMYEPFHEFTSVPPFSPSQIGSSTQTRMGQIESGGRLGGVANKPALHTVYGWEVSYPHHLENMVIKALTGTAVTLNMFIAGNPPTMGRAKRQYWGSRASTSDYTYGDRAALYLSMAIHIASDIAQYNFGPATSGGTRAAQTADPYEPGYVGYTESARRLAEFYRANQGVLDALMRAKDSDDLIGIYELTRRNGFADLPVLKDFALAFHTYATNYIEHLGWRKSNIDLVIAGMNLYEETGADLDRFTPLRDEIMWERVQYANKRNYLIVGMGTTHRENLQARLNAEGIRNEEVVQGLQEQERTINSGWTP